MSNYHNSQNQFELFPGKPDYPSENKPSGFFGVKIALPREKLFVLGIVVIIFMVLCFSFGVEKGKKLVHWGSQKEAEIPQVVQKPVVEEPALPAVLPEVEERVASLPVINNVEATPEAEVVISEPEAPQKKKVDKVYTIQVASFKSEKYANKEAKDLKRAGYEKIFVLPKGKYSIVCVGEFAQKQEAKSFSQKLKKRYKDFLIRSL